MSEKKPNVGPIYKLWVTELNRIRCMIKSLIFIFSSAVFFYSMSQETLNYKGDFYQNCLYADGVYIVPTHPDPKYQSKVDSCITTHTVNVVDKSGRYKIDSSVLILIGFVFDFDIGVKDTVLVMSDGQSRIYKKDSIYAQARIWQYYLKDLKTDKITIDQHYPFSIYISKQSKRKLYYELYKISFYGNENQPRKILSSASSDTLVLLGNGIKKNLLAGFEDVLAYFTADFGIENERNLGLK